MVQLFEFLSHHPYLTFAFFFVSGLLLWNLLGGQMQAGNQVLPQQATLLINHEDAIVLDVREDKEFVEGHILHAIHIPLGMLSDKIGRLQKYKDRPIIASCRSGNRSSSACSILLKNGFEKVYNLKGGIIAWENANLPLAKGKKDKVD